MRSARRRPRWSGRSCCPIRAIGVAGGILLGLGRALGETMAVTFVIGNAHRISASLLQPGTTISAALANEFTEAVGDIYLSSLIALGLILFVITFIVLAAAKLLLIRLEQAGREVDDGPLPQAASSPTASSSACRLSRPRSGSCCWRWCWPRCWSAASARSARRSSRR